MVERVISQHLRKRNGISHETLMHIAAAMDDAGRVYVPDSVIQLLRQSGLYRPSFSSKLRPFVADHHSVLGVEPGATETAIQKAYRRKAMKWHPDRNIGNERQAEAEMKRLNKARDALIDSAS